MRSARRWTQEEDEQVRFMWGHHPTPTIAAKLNRTSAAVYQRARDVLKIGAGCPVGFEYLRPAAERNGFAYHTFLRVLRWYGVKIHVAATLDAVRWKRRNRIVDIDDVDQAVAAWLATEPVEHAARRVGVCGATLKARLLRAGVKPPGGRKQTFRVTAAEVSRAMEL